METIDDVMKAKLAVMAWQRGRSYELLVRWNMTLMLWDGTCIMALHEGQWL